MLIAIAAIYNLEIHQMDVKTAFLNGELDEEIYMEQPEGFVAKGQEKKVCKLVKSLYGLKQAPKQWHEKFDHTMLSHGFQINECDKCVYIKKFDNGSCVIVCLYVDDMLIMGPNLDVINSTKKILNSTFDMKDMGEADVILGIRIQRSNDGYTLSQSHYVETILKKFGHFDSNPASSPFDPNCDLKKNNGDSVSQLEYSRVIGSLQYITNCTRPDIAYSVNRLARYTSNPSNAHWEALVRVLRYLKHTVNHGLHYTRYPPVLEGYSDANWISNDTEKATSGYVFTLGGAAVSWKSQKQTCAARSTMESEFIALDKTAEEAEWLKNFLEDIPLWPQPVTAICVHCDCMAAIGRAKSFMYNGKSRHIRRRHNTIKHMLSIGIISIDYVKSKENLADQFTKGLAKDKVLCLSRGMGLKPTQ
ncbi:unnamed protein product [Rhodiola kirilowii]